MRDFKLFYIAAATAVAAAPIPDVVDVLITTTTSSEDMDLAKLIKGQLAQSCSMQPELLFVIGWVINCFIGSIRHMFLCFCISFPDALEDLSIAAHIYCDVGEEGAKEAGKAVVDSKVSAAWSKLKGILVCNLLELIAEVLK